MCSRTEEWQALGASLRLEEAVELRPPTDAQIARYLGYLEASGTPVGDVRAALDTDEELLALLRSPLMLHVVALAYHGRPASALQAPGTLFGGLVVGVLGGLLASLLFMLGNLLLGDDQCVAPSSPAESAWISLPFGLFSGLLLGLGGRMVSRRSGGGAPTHRSPWSRRGVLATALLGAVCCGAPATIGLVESLVYGLAFGLTFGMVGELRAERTAPNEGIRRSARHALFAVSAVVLVSVFMGIAVNLGKGWTGVLTGLAVGTLVGLPFGLLVGLAVGGGAWLRHYAVRAALTHIGAIPWRYGSFLDAMTQRLLLRRSGGAYLFTHRLLRDHLAKLDGTRT